jgi:hypothetical protein
VEVESSTSDSSEDEDESSQVEIRDMALFMRTHKKGLKKQGYKFAKRKFPNKKKRTCYDCGSTEHFIADCPNETRENKNDKAREVTRKIQNHITREQTIVEKLILVMNGIPEMRALVKEKGRRLQPWLSRSFPPPQGCSTT